MTGSRSRLLEVSACRRTSAICWTPRGGSALWDAAASWPASTTPSPGARRGGCCSCTARAASARPRCCRSSAPGPGRPAAASCRSTAATSTRHRKGWTRPSGSPSATQPDDRQPIARLLAGAVLLIDGYEQLTPIDGWLRDELVPGLSADTVVVLAGRDPPAAPWRTDPGWRQLVAVHRLDHFDPAESGELLAHAGVAPPERPHLVALGRGHPLTMALLADLAASGQVPDTLADAPDLISALLESFLRDVPSDAHLTGLATCAIAWLTTEDLLAQLVGADAPAVWQWLARRPFITTGPRGLFAHDLARDVLDAEFERRAPERYRAYRRTIYAHAVAGLRAATGLDRQLHAQQLFFLLRNSPLADAISALRARGSATVVAGPPGRT